MAKKSIESNENNTWVNEAEQMPVVDVTQHDDGFESVSEIIPFWDFKEQPQMTGIFKGAGKDVGEGSYTTKTWLFETIKGDFFVPQWAMLSDLNGVPADKYIYRITYRGMYERADGGKFHQLKVERKERSAGL